MFFRQETNTVRAPEHQAGDMFGFGKKKSGEDGEEHRYYLLPGMGRSNRRRHKLIFLWSIAAGLAGSTLIGLAIWLLNR